MRRYSRVGIGHGTGRCKRCLRPSIRLVTMTLLLFTAGIVTAIPLIPSDAHADYTYTTARTYLRATSGNVKAYRETDLRLGDWVNTAGILWALPVRWMEAYNNVMLSSYSFTLTVFDRQTQGWPEEQKYDTQTLTYSNTPIYVHHDYYDYIDSATAIALSTSQCHSSSDCAFVLGSGAYIEVSVPYQVNAPSTTLAVTNTTYP